MSDNNKERDEDEDLVPDEDEDANEKDLGQRGPPGAGGGSVG